MDKKEIFSSFSTDDQKVLDLQKEVVKEVEMNQWAASQAEEVKIIFSYAHSLYFIFYILYFIFYILYFIFYFLYFMFYI